MAPDELQHELATLRRAFSSRRLRQALGWPAIHDFEAAHSVVLPEPYRSFVAEVGDGCPDGPPHYGLVPLGHSPDGLGPGTPTALARPFPLNRAWIWEDDPRPEKERRHLHDAVFSDGSLWLGTDGCAMHWALVVTGPHRGGIWQITDVGAQPYGRPFGHTTATSGLSGWVAHWAAGRQWYDLEHPA